MKNMQTESCKTADGGTSEPQLGSDQKLLMKI